MNCVLGTMWKPQILGIETFWGFWKVWWSRWRDLVGYRLPLWVSNIMSQEPFDRCCPTCRRCPGFTHVAQHCLLINLRGTKAWVYKEVYNINLVSDGPFLIATRMLVYYLQVHFLGQFWFKITFYEILWVLSLLYIGLYLKVTIICRYFCLQFSSKTHFLSTKFCNLCTEMVQGRQILML